VIALLLLPLLIPFAAPVFARRVVDRLDPGAALWALTLTTVVLALSSLASLGGLLLSGALQLPVVARLGDLIHPLDVGSTVLLFPVTLLSLGALTVCAGTIARSVLHQWRLLRTAQSQAATLRLAGDLSVVNDERADAYALPGNPGRIVVTSGMLRALTPSEREALFAHERAHLKCRHHYFLAVAELAAHCHPALRHVCGTIALAAERTADEAAALATGDRRLTAQAIGRAALASRNVARARSSFTPAATTGPVPQRVAALLHLPAGPRRLVSAIAVLLVLSAAVSSGATLAGAVSLHSSVEVAQGEAVGHD
jgi:Zn-dependent protease with chaperone function